MTVDIARGDLHATALETARGLSEAQRAAIAEAVHRGRFPADREPTPFADEDARGREYCFRIADQVLALPPSGIAEAVRERCARACEEQALEFLSPQYATPQPIGSIQERFACCECAGAIRALDLSNMGDGE